MGVVIVAGPSGSGKTHLARKLGWPVLNLDDFYRDYDDPSLPMSDLGIPDWDSPDSWNAADAVGTIAELCAAGVATTPVYDISQSKRVGSKAVECQSPHFIAEGLFAPTIVAACREAGVLEAAICLRRPRLATFALRFFRDVKEARKSLPVLVRRGIRLYRRDPEIIAAAVQAGCQPMSPLAAYRRLRALA